MDKNWLTISKIKISKHFFLNKIWKKNFFCFSQFLLKFYCSSKLFPIDFSTDENDKKLKKNGWNFSRGKKTFRISEKKIDKFFFNIFQLKKSHYLKTNFQIWKPEKNIRVSEKKLKNFFSVFFRFSKFIKKNFNLKNQFSNLKIWKKIWKITIFPASKLTETSKCNSDKSCWFPFKSINFHMEFSVNPKALPWELLEFK